MSESGPDLPLTPEDRAAWDGVLLQVAQTAFLADPLLSGGPPSQIGVAVSGGSDSMALLQAFHLAFPGKVRAVTVDHGLRRESALEAAGVAGFCAQRSIPHDILRWQGPAPAGNLMDQARRARLSLIADWAKAFGISHVLLGHTADDQAESFLMNLGRKAGLDGLSGMRSLWVEQGICWMRPLLQIHRQDLRGFLVGQGLGWVDDPSNDNDRFTRVKARKVLKSLAPLGITAATLVASVNHLASARQALNRALYQALGQCIAEKAGAICLQASDFQRMMPELQRQTLIAVIGWMAGAGYAPREAQLFRLGSAVLRGDDATLGGVRFQHRQGTLRITREPRAVQGPVPYGQMWDHRWRITGPECGPDYLAPEVRALGGAGLAQCPDWRMYGPRDALVVTPAVWSGDVLIAAPLAGLLGNGARPYHAELSQGLAEFILSH